MHRHPGLNWEDVRARLEANPEKLQVLKAMEETGGEPDVNGQDEQGRNLYCACSKASPTGRRGHCYDGEAEAQREMKGVATKGNVLDLARQMGVELLDEEQYIALQQLGPFDTKTSTWVKEPVDVRNIGGPLFGDHRYGRTFIYHTSAGSFYSSQGFRGLVRV